MKEFISSLSALFNPARSKLLKIGIAVSGFLYGLLKLIDVINNYPDTVSALQMILASPIVTTIIAFDEPIRVVMLLGLAYFTYEFIRLKQDQINDLMKLPTISRNSAELHWGVFNNLHHQIVKARIRPLSEENIRLLEDSVLHALAISSGHAAEEMTILSGHRCHGCIKKLRANGKLLVLVRDPLGSANRKDRDKTEYSYDENSAFRKIVDRGEREYIENDLVAKSKDAEDPYVNAAEDWADHYTATYVLPLCCGPEYGRNNVYGFFCVDNIGGGFDAKYCREVMKRYAAIHARILMMLDECKNAGNASSIEMANIIPPLAPTDEAVITKDHTYNPLNRWFKPPFRWW